MSQPSSDDFLPSDSLFPTLLSAETPPAESTHIDTIAQTQMLLSSAMQRLRYLAKSDRGDSADWRELLNTATKLHDALAGKRPIDSEAVATFPTVLRRRREEAGLTVRELSALSGISSSLLKQIEEGTRRVTPRTVRQLLTVPALRLESDPAVPMIYPATRGNRSEPLNFWLAPNFDPVGMLEDLKSRLQTPGGVIEQTYAYLDHQSAIDYCKMVNDPKYTIGYRNMIPLDQAAAEIAAREGRRRIDIVALGAGDGKLETRFAQALVAQQEEPDLRFYLLDISQPLLSKAHRTARDALDDIRGVAVFGMQGSFHFLPLFEQIFYSPSRRQRVFTLLGGTLCNLDDVPRFFRESLRAAQPGDYVVVDFQTVYAPSNDLASIRKNDPALNNPLSPGLCTWLGGPFQRYAGASDVRFSLQVEQTCSVPGGYSLEAMANVVRDNQLLSWRFSRFTRVDRDAFAEVMASIGWKCVWAPQFGSSERNFMLMLLRKQ